MSLVILRYAGNSSRIPLLCTITVFLLLGIGCHWSRENLIPHDSAYDFGDLNIDAYVDNAVAHELSEIDSAGDGKESVPVRRASVTDLDELDHSRVQSITLADAFVAAVEHSAFIRNRVDFLSPGNGLLTNPQFTPSAFDVLMQRTSQRGVEAALADFDLQMAAGAHWGQNSILQGNRYLYGGIPPADVLVSDTGSVFARLDKPLKSGGTVSLVHNWNYTFNNLPSLSFNPRYAGYLRGEFRQPLWSGRGPQFTSIAGPTSYRNRASGRGVALADIDETMAQLEFEAQLQRLLVETEVLYWDLWLAEQVYRQLAEARDRARDVWSRQRQRAKSGLNGGSAADVSQAEENFYQRETMVHGALDEIFQAGVRLRRHIGMPSQNDVLLISADQPSQAEVLFDWQEAISRALQRRTELRRQQLRIRSAELQLIPAKSLALPQLDLVTGVQANGLGNTLFDSSGSGVGSAYGSLFDANDVGWNVGFEFSMPWGFRRERTQIRYLELHLAKARAALAAQEAEIAHELAHAFGNLNRWSAALQSTTKRAEAAGKRLKAVEADYLAGRRSLDLLLRSQVSVAEAEIERVRSIAEYNKAIADVVFRQGTIELPPLDSDPMPQVTNPLSTLTE